MSSNPTEALERAIVSGASVQDALVHARHANDGDATPQERQRVASPSTSDELASSSSRSASPYAASSTMANVPSDRPGANTGVKGVRADARAAQTATQAARTQSIVAANERMQRMALNSSTTWREDEAARQADTQEARAEQQELDRLRERRLAELRSSQGLADERRRRRLAGEEADEASSDSENTAVLDLPMAGLAGAARTPAARRTGFFGHLREVDESGFADAIDREAPTTSVVVHLYERIVPACARLTAALASLARTYPHTKFLQARASAIGFGTGGASSYDALDDEDALEAAAELVPTLLVYRAGVVVANLVRVDLEPGWRGGEEKDIRDLLASHAAISFATNTAVESDGVRHYAPNSRDDDDE